MKLAYVATLYTSFIEALYAHYPSLTTSSSAQQQAALDREGFGLIGAIAPALSPLGYQVLEVSANVEPMQKAWAAENGVAWPLQGWQKEIAYQQVVRFQPEVLFLDNPVLFDRIWIMRVRENCPKLKIVLGFTATSSYVLDTIKCYDAAISCLHSQLATLRQSGIKGFYLRHAFNESVLSHLPVRGQPISEICFAGGMVRATNYHLEREQLLESLAKKIPLSIYCSQVGISRLNDTCDTALRRLIFVVMQSLKTCGLSAEKRRQIPLVGRSADWTSWPLSQINPRLRSLMKPAVFGLEMFSTLRHSAIALNKHIDHAGSEAGNMRLFEATGAGTCLLTDFKENLGEFFDLDREIVCFSSAEECVEKGQWLLSHPKECEAIAAAGQSRTLRDHTYNQRAAELDGMIQELLRGDLKTGNRVKLPEQL